MKINKIRKAIMITASFFGMLGLVLTFAPKPALAMAPLGDTFIHTVGSSSDDATQSVVGGILDTSAAILVLGDFDGLSSTVVGIRFTNIEIPQGGTVSNARVTLTAAGDWSGSTTLFINGHDVGDSPTFSGGSGPLNRTGQLTSAGVATTPGDWVGGIPYQSPDLSAVLNEIFARPDWAFGNALSLIIQDDGVVNNVRREAVSFDGNPSEAAELTYFFAEEPDQPVGPGASISPDWIITDFTLTRNNDCADSAPDECGISFQYTLEDNNGNSSFLADVETNNVHIVDLSGQEFAPGPHPGGTGFIPYSEFPSLAYADLMACGPTGLLAIVDGGVYGEVNTANNWAVYDLLALNEATDVHFPSEPITSWFRPSQHDLFSLLLPTQYFIQAPSTVDTPCLPLAMLGDYQVQMTVSIEGQQVAQYVEPPGDYFWHMFGWGSPRPHTGDDILIELLLNSDNGIEEQDYSNNTCQIHMGYQRRTANPLDIITYDILTLVSTSGCEVVFGVEDFILGPSSEQEALTGLGAGEEDAKNSGLAIGIIVIIIATVGGAAAGRRFAPGEGSALLPTAVGGVVGAGIAAGLVVVVASMGSGAVIPESISGEAPASALSGPDYLDGLVRQSDDEHPTFCDEFAHTYAEAITDAAGEVEDILIHIAVPSNVTLPPDSRFRVTVKGNNGAPRVIVTDETIVSLASAGLYPDSVSLPFVWQLQIEFLAGSGGDLFLPMCFPDQLHTFVGDSFAVPSPAPTIVGTPPTPADTSAPTVTNISVKPATVPIKSGTVSISAIVADPSGVATVMVYYRTSGGKWFSARMTLAGGRYTAVLSQFGTAGKWEFHIRAVDRVGNENCSIAKRSACPGGSFVVTPP